MSEISYFGAWHHWLNGENVAACYLWHFPILWWGRVGKVVSFISALAVIAELIGHSRISVTSVEASPKKRGLARQTPRVSITIRRTGLAKRRPGRSELKIFSDWNDDRPETELNFKFYRQATNKIVGISEEVAVLLRGFFYRARLPK